MTEDEETEFIFVDQEPDDELSCIFKENPTIEHYLKLRAENTGKEIEVAATEGFDWVLENDQLLRDNGIEPGWVLSAMDAQHESINLISLTLLQKLADRKRLIGEGKTQIASRGEAVTDAFVNYLIAIMLDALSWNNYLEIPRDLIVLARYQLLGTEEPAMLKRLKAKHLKTQVMEIAANYLERQEEVSFRKIAKVLQINVSTISRMYSDGELEKQASRHLRGLKHLTNSETPYADMIARHLATKEQKK